MKRIDKTIERLVWLAEARLVPEEAFDEDVHDMAQEVELDDLNSIEDEDEQEEHISGVESDASDVNNGGFPSQFRFLMKECGWSRADIEAKIAEYGSKGKFVVVEAQGQVDVPADAKEIAFYKNYSHRGETWRQVFKFRSIASADAWCHEFGDRYTMKRFDTAERAVDVADGENLAEFIGERA